MDNSYPYKCIISDKPIVRANADQVPVYAFGYTYIYKEAPLLTKICTIQNGNKQSWTSIPIKRSHEILSNGIGTTAPRMPRLTEHDERPLEPIHLIDGNPETCWSSRSLPAHDCEPAWIRLDLVAEKTISSVILRKRKSKIDRSKPGFQVEKGVYQVGQCMTDHITIRISRDSSHWLTVYDGESGDADDKYDFIYSFSPVASKQIMIIGSEYKRMESILCCFSIACIEILDISGNNCAKVQYGTGITVSSTHVGAGLEIETHRWLWPVHHDLGLKWVRVGYHDDVINWHWVEREKGKLKIDKVANDAITELTENGIEVMMCLNFGNRLYQADSTRYLPQMWEMCYETPEPPKTQEALQAWERYIRFMVENFRDRVNYFEVWNEWNMNPYWGDTPDVDLFIKISLIAYKVIRELAPKAKIVMGSISNYPSLSQLSLKEQEILAQTNISLRAIRALAKFVDVIGYHPFYCLDPATEKFMHYEQDIYALMAFCRNSGFKGKLCASEFNIAANYPKPDGENWWGDYQCSELVKAKYCARVAIMHTAMEVGSFFCETFSNSFPMDLSLMRRGFPQGPIMPLQPDAAYYVTRNMCTLLDGLHASSLKPILTGNKEGLACYVLENDKQLVVALWQQGRGYDNCTYQEIDIRIFGIYKAVSGVDLLNGQTQNLYFILHENEIEINNLLVGDYPLWIICIK